MMVLLIKNIKKGTSKNSIFQNILLILILRTHKVDKKTRIY